MLYLRTFLISFAIFVAVIIYGQHYIDEYKECTVEKDFSIPIRCSFFTPVCVREKEWTIPPCDVFSDRPTKLCRKNDSVYQRGEGICTVSLTLFTGAMGYDIKECVPGDPECTREYKKGEMIPCPLKQRELMSTLFIWPMGFLLFSFWLWKGLK